MKLKNHKIGGGFSGFTLIELLAVIVILAIIALIATPLVMNTIKKVRVGAFKDSVNKIISAIENGYAEKLMDAELPTETVLTYTNGTKTTEGNIEVNYKGKNPNDGKIRISSEGKIGLSLYENNNCISKTYNSSTLVVKETTKANCTLENQIDTSRANAPILSNGMTPIKWSGTTEVVTTENDPEWYDYSKQKWANAKTKDGSYWVWIPRYGYKIPAENYHTAIAGTIDIKFLDNDTNKNQTNTTINTSGYSTTGTNTSNAYFLHPAFSYDTSKYGYWIAKFEPTAVEGITNGYSTNDECDSTSDNVTTLTLKVMPNARSWRCIDSKIAYQVTLDLKIKGNIYGWNKNEVDTHMMTNYEWGAVAYLSNSIYGANQEIWNNSQNEYTTGCSGSGVDSANESICVAYNSANGVKASTTHNITGVYDISGGAADRVMAKYGNDINLSGFTEDELFNIPNNHITMYEPTEKLNNKSYTYNQSKYGDAMYETTSIGARYDGLNWIGNENDSWYGDVSKIPYPTASWMIRGTSYRNDIISGAFAFSQSDADSNTRITFRPTIGMYK